MRMVFGWAFLALGVTTAAAEPLTAKSTGRAYLEASTLDRLTWTKKVADLADEKASESRRAELSLQIAGCIDQTLTKDREAQFMRQQALGDISIFCAAGLTSGMIPTKRR